jgi:tellurite resistance protein TehA-like permease
MGTGIVSVGLSVDHHETLSRVVLGIAAAVWLGLGLVAVYRTLSSRADVLREVYSPPALTAVAATAVLGTRLAVPGWTWAAAALLVLSLLLWLLLFVPVLRAWTTPTVGISLMLPVSTTSLAVLAATLARNHGAWLLYAALAPFLLGLALYPFVISRFDFGQVLTGWGDHWITGGALAISTLAAGRIALTAGSHHLAGLADVMKVTTVVLWALTIGWLPVLLGGEALRPRLVIDLRRWSTVFPVGMYAACSFITGTVAPAPAITDFAHVWVWVGLAVWLLVSLAMLSRALTSQRRKQGPDRRTPQRHVRACHPVAGARVRRGSGGDLDGGRSALQDDRRA